MPTLTHRLRPAVVVATAAATLALSLGGAVAGAQAAQNPDNSPICYDGDEFYGCSGGNPGSGPALLDVFELVDFDVFGNPVYVKANRTTATPSEIDWLRQGYGFDSCSRSPYPGDLVTCTVF